MTSAGTLQIRDRGGRLVPFEADWLSRALFATTEALGNPDAFLARELADQIAASLAAELDGEPEALTAMCLDRLRRALETTGLRGLVHLNVPSAPAWASDPAVGPLFAGFAGGPPADRLRAVAEALFDGLTAAGAADPRLV